GPTRNLERGRGPPRKGPKQIGILSLMVNRFSSWPWGSAWLWAGLANSRSNGALPRLQCGADLVLRAVQYLTRPGFDTLQRVHGPAADVARPALEIVADVVAPVPHDECSGERAQ